MNTKFTSQKNETNISMPDDSVEIAPPKKEKKLDKLASALRKNLTRRKQSTKK
jgi:hypothetical protein